MASMDYCKFENTCEDMEKCVKHLEHNRPMGNPYEASASRRLYELAKEYITAFEGYKPEDEDEDE